MILIVILEMLERLLGFFQNVLSPIQKLQSEILPLPLVHERLTVRWAVEFVEDPNVLVVLVKCVVGATILALHRLHGLLCPHTLRSTLALMSSRKARPY